MEQMSPPKISIDPILSDSHNRFKRVFPSAIINIKHTTAKTSNFPDSEKVFVNETTFVKEVGTRIACARFSAPKISTLPAKEVAVRRRQKVVKHVISNR